MIVIVHNFSNTQLSEKIEKRGDREMEKKLKLI